MALTYSIGRRGFLGFLKSGLTGENGATGLTGVIPAFSQVDSTGAEVPSGTVTNPINITGGTGGGAATIADGADVAEGAKADAAYAGSGSASVVSILKGLYNALIAPIVAGTNIIGKVGIDQTTPGTTNGVVINSSALPANAATATGQASLLAQTLGGRLVSVKGAIPNGTTFAAGQGIGGLITISTSQVSTTFSSYSIKIKVRGADTTTLTNPIAHVFDANPSTSTFIDGAAPSVSTADMDKVSGETNASFAGVIAGNVSFAVVNGTRTTTDSGGNIYLSLAATGAGLYVANTWRYEFTGQY